MIRILLIITLLFYVLYKFGFFRALSSGYNEGQIRRPPNGNVNVDSAPQQKEKKRSGFKGGEYVDYEEIK